MENYSKTNEFKEVLKKEDVSEEQARFIYNQMSKVNWKIRALQKEGYKLENLNPSCLRSLLEQYNKRDDVNLFTGEILSSDTNVPASFDKGDTISLVRGTPVNIITDTSGSMW